MFTPSAQAIIDAAKDIAFARSAGELEVADLLTSLVHQPQAGVLLGECLDRAPAALRASCPAPPRGPGCPHRMSLSTDVRALLSAAKELARAVPDRSHPGLIDASHLACAVAASAAAAAVLGVPPLDLGKAPAVLARFYQKEAEAPQLRDMMEKIRTLRSELLSRVVGQDQAVHTFVEGLFNAEVLALADTRRKAPRAVFLFAGPPGVGKTFLAETGAAHLERPFKRFDMSAYSGHYANEQLVGAAGFYHGARRGLLTEYVEKNPDAILLFDEIEKAHLNTIHYFLQILDVGTLEDKLTEKSVEFRDTIIIFTSNAGRRLYESPNRNGIQSANSRFCRRTILDALQQEKQPTTGEPVFPAAICSRLATGYPVLFNRLSVNDLERVVRAELLRTAGLFERQYYKRVEVDEDLPICLVAREGDQTDARTLCSQAAHFVKTEVFRLCQLFRTDRLEEALRDVDLIHLGLDANTGGMSADVQSLLAPEARPKVLLVAGTGLTGLYCGAIPEVDWRLASTAQDALEILAREDVDMALLDIWLGREAAGASGVTMKGFDYVPASAHDVGRGQELLRSVRECMPEVPVYMLALDAVADQAGTGAIDDELVLACVGAGGARGVLTSGFVTSGVQGWREDRDRLLASLQRTASRLCRERAAARLARERKALAFDTAPRLDRERRTVRIGLRNFRLVRAIAAGDVGELVEDVERPKTKFSDVIGADAAKEELQFFVRYLRNPREFAAAGLKAQKGVLLHGPPGTGKTLLARAMAGETDVAFVSTSASTFVTGSQGSGAQSIRDLFARARRYAPAILFIDEIDTIGKRRTGSGREQEDALNALLTEIDGFASPSPDRPVFVLAATNFEVEEDSASDDNLYSNRSLDAALVRRFSRAILVDLPDHAARLKYMKMRLNNRPACTVTDETIQFITERSSGMSIAVLELIIETAARRAVEAGADLTDEILVNALKCHPVSEADLERPTTRFDDVIGAEAAKKGLRSFVDYLKDPERYASRGLKPPKGVLLHGPPGTGKTLLARAMAGETNATFISVPAASLQSRWHGQDAKNVRDLFVKARRRAPAIVFIDEIDAIARQRTGEEASWQAAALNALLTEMDGFVSPSPDRPVLVLAATNAEVEDKGGSRSGGFRLDAALVRRFSRVCVDLPDRAARLEYLAIQLKNRPASTVSNELIRLIAGRSTRMSLADLERVIDAAARRSAELGQPLSDQLFEQAFEEELFGEVKAWKPDILRRVAQHEAGHTVMYWLSGQWPSYVTIVARGQHGGYMDPSPEDEDDCLLTKDQWVAKIRTSLGGRGAEVVYYGRQGGLSTGASADLEKATYLTRIMVTEYGMDEEFGLCVGMSKNGTFLERAAVNRVLSQEMDCTIELLEANRRYLDAVSEALMRQERLSREDLQKIWREQASPASNQAISASGG